MIGIQWFATYKVSFWFFQSRNAVRALWATSNYAGDVALAIFRIAESTASLSLTSLLSVLTHPPQACSRWKSQKTTSDAGDARESAGSSVYEQSGGGVRIWAPLSKHWECLWNARRGLELHNKCSPITYQTRDLTIESHRGTPHCHAYFETMLFINFDW